MVRTNAYAYGGRRENTTFLTVREAMGLVDYLANGSQREGVLY